MLWSTLITREMERQLSLLLQAIKPLKQDKRNPMPNANKQLNSWEMEMERERDQQKDSLSTTFFFFFSLPPQRHRSLVSAGGRGCLWLRGQNFAHWHRWEWSGTAGWGTGDTRNPGQRNSSRQYTHVSLYDTPEPHQPMNQQTNQFASLLQCCNQ